MKRISTLFAIALFSANAFAQNVSESFNTQTEVANLTASCWSFNNVNHSNAAPISDAGSVVSTQ